MAVTLAEQEARRDHLSGGSGGGAISVDADYDSAADVTVVHHVTDGHADSVWVQAFNSTADDVTLQLVLNPSDTTSTAAIDAATVTLTIPPQDSLWILQGDTVRLRGTNTWAIAAYVATADAGSILLTGYVVRVKGASLY